MALLLVEEGMVLPIEKPDCLTHSLLISYSPACFSSVSAAAKLPSTRSWLTSLVFALLCQPLFPLVSSHTLTHTPSPLLGRHSYLGSSHLSYTGDTGDASQATGEIQYLVCARPFLFILIEWIWPGASLARMRSRAESAGAKLMARGGRGWA
jgi:hypothetical protein